jgi:hypothetical protein
LMMAPGSLKVDDVKAGESHNHNDVERFVHSVIELRKRRSGPRRF